jgi:hypothetical protein
VWNNCNLDGFLEQVMRHRFSALLVLSTVFLGAQTTVVKPRVLDEVLTNPGIGFTTFQRFNGDSLNVGTNWTEGLPIEYQQPKTMRDPGYPATTIAYFRIYWKFLEPEKGKYRWEMMDRALDTAHRRGQRLMVRIAPHGTGAAEDVPEWYRKETGEALRTERLKTSWQSKKEKWMVDPENPAYAQYFGAFVRKFAERYDGHPDMELVDISILAAWGEGAGSELLTEPTRRALIDAYMEGFHRTPLVTQLSDPATVRYTLSRARNFGAKGDLSAPVVGWRADCLGDMGGFSKTSNLMTDYYPEHIVALGLTDAWKEAPVTMESCWVMQKWKDDGWSLKEIMDQAIKWHVSSFNNKSSAVPEPWWPQVNDWLKHMGYRFALRRFEFTSSVDRTRRLSYSSWWENLGNAPLYQPFVVTLRLKQGSTEIFLPLDGDPRAWMPGDTLLNDSVFLPNEIRDGQFELSLALTDPAGRTPRIRLASEGSAADGWLPLGKVQVNTAAK